MWSYVITQKKIVEMKWENYKITVLENASLYYKWSSSFCPFLSPDFAVYIYLVEMY